MLVYSDELLADSSYMKFTVYYLRGIGLDRLRVHLNIILLLL